MPAGVKTAGIHHLKRMQSPTDPADRTGTIGVEAFDAAYGAGFPRRRTTRRTPSSASWSRTAGRSSRTGRPTRTVPAASPSSTAPLRTEARLNPAPAPTAR